jgi:multimeric flavodoxin WrbA
MVRILGISASPRQAGTAYCIRHGLAEIERLFPQIETEFLSLAGRDVRPCCHCDVCVRSSSGCIYDDGLDAQIAGLHGFDAYLIGSPVYGYSISPQLAAFFSRFRPNFRIAFFEIPRALAYKAGAALAVGGTRHGGQEHALDAINSWFLSEGILPVGGQAFQYGGASVVSMDKKAKGAKSAVSGVKADEEGLAVVAGVARRLAEVTLVLRAGLEAYDGGKLLAGLDAQTTKTRQQFLTRPKL